MTARRRTEFHHVVPNSDGGGDVRRGGASQASVHRDTKQEAVDRACTISRNQQTELCIHNQDARISRSDSHGNDPNPPHG